MCSRVDPNGGSAEGSVYSKAPPPPSQNRGISNRSSSPSRGTFTCPEVKSSFMRLKSTMLCPNWVHTEGGGVGLGGGGAEQHRHLPVLHCDAEWVQLLFAEQLQSLYCRPCLVPHNENNLLLSLKHRCVQNRCLICIFFCGGRGTDCPDCVRRP